MSASRQNQALCALIFLYRCVLGQSFSWLEDVVHAKHPQYPPVVLTSPEVRALVAVLEGVHWIMASLLYGAGLRLLECLRLRVQDMDFASRQILLEKVRAVSDGRTMLPDMHEKGYDIDEVRDLLAEFEFTTHIRARGEEAKALKQERSFKLRRWVAERTHGWMTRLRRALIRWDKKVCNDLGVLHLACADITCRQSGLWDRL